MKLRYYVSIIAQGNRDHEVHNERCRYVPLPEHRNYLGEFESCHEAVKEAKKQFSRADGCRHCSPDCHNS